MEVSNAYLTRALEVNSMILQAEADGVILRGSKLYKYRTGELRSFIEMAKAAQELGSRRLTARQLELEYKDALA